MDTLYRRPLPADTIAFSSAEGRRLFAEALAAGGLDGYFSLAEQFHTQSEPAYCGLGSLVVALNALSIDPGRLWKGPWRWFSEEMLDCCVPLEQVKQRGLDVDELACLARCNGADVTLTRADARGLADWQAALDVASRGSAVVIAAYDRAALGQTGSGHFSPLGGYHAARDLVLVLDVARFKYPAHWVPAARLREAMQSIDPATGRSRGWLVLRARHALSLGFSLKCDGGSLEDLAHRVDAAITELGATTDVARLARGVHALLSHVEVRTPTVTAHAEALVRARAALREVPLHAQVAEAVGAEHAEVVTLLLLALVACLPPEQQARMAATAVLGPLPVEPALTAELDNLHAQLDALRSRALH